MLGATSAAIGCLAFYAGIRDLVPRTAPVTRPLNSQWCGSWKCQPHVPRILTCVAKLKPFCRGAGAFGRGLRVEIPSLGSERQRQASFHRTACCSHRGCDSHARNREADLAVSLRWMTSCPTAPGVTSGATRFTRIRRGRTGGGMGVPFIFHPPCLSSLTRTAPALTLGQPRDARRGIGGIFQ